MQQSGQPRLYYITNKPRLLSYKGLCLQVPDTLFVSSQEAVIFRKGSVIYGRPRFATDKRGRADISEFPLQKQKTPRCRHFHNMAACPLPGANQGDRTVSNSASPSIYSPSTRASPFLFFSLPHIPSELDVNKLITDEQGTHLLRF